MKQSKYTKEILLSTVKDSRSFSEVLRRLNLRPSGGNHRLISNKVLEYKIDISHFKGKGWNKGLTIENDERVRRSVLSHLPDKSTFVVKAVTTNYKTWKRRLLRNGRIYQCEICKITNWQNNPISLDIDHINGNPIDNRFENLRFLCPNCHRQTNTWGAKKR